MGYSIHKAYSNNSSIYDYFNNTTISVLTGVLFTATIALPKYSQWERRHRKEVRDKYKEIFLNAINKFYGVKKRQIVIRYKGNKENQMAAEDSIRINVQGEIETYKGLLRIKPGSTLENIYNEYKLFEKKEKAYTKHDPGSKKEYDAINCELDSSSEKIRDLMTKVKI